MEQKGNGDEDVGESHSQKRVDESRTRAVKRQKQQGESTKVVTINFAAETVGEDDGNNTQTTENANNLGRQQIHLNNDSDIVSETAQQQTATATNKKNCVV